MPVVSSKKSFCFLKPSLPVAVLIVLPVTMHELRMVCYASERCFKRGGFSIVPAPPKQTKLDWQFKFIFLSIDRNRHALLIVAAKEQRVPFHVRISSIFTFSMM